MTTQTVESIKELIQQIWTNDFYPALRQTNVLANIFLRQDYQGAIAGQGSSVQVPTIAPLTATQVDIGGADQKEVDIVESDLAVNYIDVKADKMAQVSVSLGKVAQLQGPDLREKLREEMFAAIFNQIESTLQAVLIASNANPAHRLAYATDNALIYDNFVTARELLGLQKVPKTNRWAISGVSTYSNALKQQFLISADKIGTDNLPVQTGNIRDVAGFATVEADGIPASQTVFAHASAAALVIQKQPEILISNQHAAGKLADLITLYTVFGVKLMDDKRLVTYTNP